MPLNARHELFVQLAGKPDAKGEFIEARDAMLKCHHVIANFAQIFGTSIDNRSRLGGEEFTQRRLCAFNLAR